MDALQMSNLTFKICLHKDQIWSITYKTKETAYSVLKTRQGNYAFGLGRSLLPWSYRTRPFLDTLLGHPILYMPLKNPLKTYQIRLMDELLCTGRASISLIFSDVIIILISGIMIADPLQNLKNASKVYLSLSSMYRLR